VIRNRRTKLRMLAAGLASWMAFLAGAATHSAAAQTTAKPAPAARSLENQGGEPREGIKEHGHWTIEIRNPDGSLVSHREFENSLIGNGGQALAFLLDRQQSVGYWTINLAAAGGQAGPCPSTNPLNPDSQCLIKEVPAFRGPEYSFPTLKVSGPDTDPKQSNITLNGSAIAGGNSQIGTVGTTITFCPPTIAPSTPCGDVSGQVLAAGTMGVTFSGATVTPAISVAKGQTIQVTVVISFS
jgi:hypothetical protein